LSLKNNFCAAGKLLMSLWEQINFETFLTFSDCSSNYSN